MARSPANRDTAGLFLLIGNRTDISKRIEEDIDYVARVLYFHHDFENHESAAEVIRWE